MRFEKKNASSDLSFNLAKVYATGIHRNFLTYYAAWPPGIPLSLGDYGEIQDNIFMPKDNIVKKFEIPLKIKHVTDKQDYEYISPDNVFIRVENDSATVGGSIKSIRAIISFSQKQTLYFRARNCRLDSIDNLGEVEESIRKLYQKGDWDKDSVIITGLVFAEGTTVLISGGNPASITLSGNSIDKSIIDLADPSAGLTVINENNIGLKYVAIQGFTPLFQLSQIHGFRDLGTPRIIPAPASETILSEDFESGSIQ
jgi:hypothetical protein